ncbi:hypothetical protein [Pseudorhodoplanes sinuspersici]|uniref:Uncharacterized protein n=1 Tax=Pseudorhodoplanes sinuspersici TaxID=1235591 RepID=A0A1W6ZTN6_9HYPH|nr:hypothetical protein [Pseudorhodoplanes sinuspersici]ARQ00779.1 hypothetical protein CAK95_18065 [Pseudorhodoplanes sinuspersici]
MGPPAALPWAANVTAEVTFRSGIRQSLKFDTLPSGTSHGPGAFSNRGNFIGSSRTAIKIHDDEHERAMNDPETPEKHRQTDQREAESNRNTRMPFDISDLRRLPTATDDDPPYRNWWVGDER